MLPPVRPLPLTPVPASPAHCRFPDALAGGSRPALALLLATKLSRRCPRAVSVPSEEALRPMLVMPRAPKPAPQLPGATWSTEVKGAMIDKPCGRMTTDKTRMSHLRKQPHWQAVADAKAAARLFREEGGRWAEGEGGDVAFDLASAEYETGGFASMDGTWPETVAAMGGDDESLVGPPFFAEAELRSKAWRKRRGGQLRLEPNVMLEHLPRHLRLRLWRYLTGMDVQKEGPRLWQVLAEADWSQLRVKELFESCEVAKVAAEQVQVAESSRPITHIYDLACGHGLVGALMALRFPEKKVVCVDRMRRPSFSAVVDRYRASARCARQPALGNVEFLEGDAFATLRARFEREGKPEGAQVLAVHACGEATPLAIELAEEHGFCWLVVPCCFDEGLYLPLAPIRPRPRRPSNLAGQRQRYLFVCGALAARHEAWLVKEIECRVTDRNLVLLGGSAWRSDAQGRGAWNPFLPKNRGKGALRAVAQ